MTEEEAFWTFTSLIENLMPIDYFQNMIGARVDQNIIEILIRDKFPRLEALFAEHHFMASMVTLQWFTTLFSYSFNFAVL